MRVSELYIYPVKSLRGIKVSSAEIDELGLVGDRRYLVVDEHGQQLTQRPLPKMSLVETELTADHLILRTPGFGSCVVPRRSETKSELVAVTVWRSSDLQADDCGDEPAALLTSFLGTKCKLVRIGKDFRRPILDPLRARQNDLVSFADGYPFLITSEASLRDLNDRLIANRGDPIPMNRFRPNIVITDCLAFAEDTWPRVKIGEVVFRAGGPCGRCIVTTTDQITAERGKEPLKTLATFRRDPKQPGDVNFGQNLIHETKAGRLHVGDLAEALNE